MYLLELLFINFEVLYYILEDGFIEIVVTH